MTTVDRALQATRAILSKTVSGHGAIDAWIAATGSGGIATFSGCEITAGNVGPSVHQASAPGEPPVLNTRFFVTN